MFLIPLPDETRIATGFSHKAIISYLDINTIAATTGTLALFPYQPPGMFVNNAVQTQAAGQLAVGACVKKAAVNCTTPFAGPSITAVVIDVGDGGSVGRYVANSTTDLLTAVASNTKNPVLGSAGYTYTGSDVAATHSQVQAKITATGANLSVLTAGQVEVYFDFVDLTRLTKVSEAGTP